MAISDAFKIITKKTPPHKKAEIVDLFKEFLGGFSKDYPYEFWLRKVGKCDYGQALSIIKELETLPIKYNKAGAIINKLKKFNDNNRRGTKAIL